jgi:hypothetical protein
MTMGGPQLEFGVSGGPKPREIVVATGIEIDPLQRLRVAAIETLGETHHCRQHFYGAAHRTRQIAVPLV